MKQFAKILLPCIKYHSRVLTDVAIYITIIHVMIKIVHVLIYKTKRSGVKCIASLYCYKLSATCKTHAVVV